MSSADEVRNDPPVCDRCGDEYLLRDGCDQTSECDECAHAALSELRTSLSALRSERDAMERERDARITEAVAAHEAFPSGTPNGRLCERVVYLSSRLSAALAERDAKTRLLERWRDLFWAHQDDAFIAKRIQWANNNPARLPVEEVAEELAILRLVADTRAALARPEEEGK